MWLMTNKGFFSVVEKKKGEFQIRARVRGDLVNLQMGTGVGKNIISTPDADYAYRLVVNRDEMIAAVTWLAEQVDYNNFKGAINNIPDQRAKHDPYLKVWGVLHSALQPPQRVTHGQVAGRPWHENYASRPQQQALGFGKDRHTYCEQCNEEVSPNSVRCPHCGTPFE